MISQTPGFDSVWFNLTRFHLTPVRFTPIGLTKKTQTDHITGIYLKMLLKTPHF